MTTALLTCIAASAATPVWTGLGANHNWTTPANWQNSTPPANNGTDVARFGVSNREQVFVDVSQNVQGLVFDFSGYSSGYVSYTLLGAAGRTLTLGSAGITVTSGSTTEIADEGVSSEGSYGYGSVYLDSSLGVVLGTNQTWSTEYNSSLTVASTISGTGTLTITGEGMTTLEGANTYTGGTVVNSADVFVGSNTAFGTGSVTLKGYTSLFNYYGDRTLSNAFTFEGNVVNVHGYEGFMKFAGPVTLASSPTVSNYGDTLFFDGNIGETGGSRMLTFSGTGANVLSGQNTYTGGTAVYDGVLLFRNATSIPATGALSTQAYGYIGIAFNTGTQSGFLDKFTKNQTYGAIGFDTDPSVPTPTVFAEGINLTGFTSSARLGSSTRAILSGTITPASGAGYRFGHGGGTLTVQSKLTGANALTVDSVAGAELTLQLINPNPASTAPWNDYTGQTTATNSAIVFGPATLSSGSANGSFVVNNGGYIGTQDLTPAAFIPKFSSSVYTGVIGFDSANRNAPRTVSGIDLSPFTSSGTSIALGTTSAAILSGTITLPAGQSTYWFTGYKGGALTVDSVLTGARAVNIGDVYGEYPDVDPQDETRMSTVFLNGSNLHSGGTRLYSGRLVLGSTTALGTGPLVIGGNYYSEHLPRVETSLTTNPTFVNPVLVDSDFEIGGVNSFTLSGGLSDSVEGYGTLWKHGTGTLTLTGNNTSFTGGFYVSGGTLAFVGSNAVGTGDSTLSFGALDTTTATASFVTAPTTGTAAPKIAGLSSYYSGARVQLGSGVTLTVQQGFDDVYLGSIQGSGGLVKTGPGDLRLEGASTFTGGTTISNGTVTYAATGALGTGGVTLNGSNAGLIVESGTTFSNTFGFGPSGGVLSGNGVFGGSIVLTANSGIAPGASVGQLTFNAGLTWNGGAFYDVEIQEATGSAGSGFDSIHVNGTLVFNATTTLPFTLNLSSLTAAGASGNLSNFVATSPYSWQIVTTTGGIAGFNPAAVFINQAGFTNNLGVGSFNLSVSGNSLLLNFTPVPEPSTWALMIAGAGVFALALRRRRRS